MPPSTCCAAGGKRFRPLLVMLAAQFGDPYAPGIVPAAVVVELTHLATLYHDDVMDEADVRRGVASANARWGNSVAVLTGDFLFARASHILADLGPEAVRMQARGVRAAGRPARSWRPRPARGRDPVEHYLDVIAGKTGSLIAVSGRFGALMSGADESVVDILTQYGERLGVAFQLADDVLDIASDSHESGKTPGTDLREGIPTLPVLRLRETAARGGVPDDLRAVAAARRRPDRRRPARRGARRLRAHPALEQARRDTVRYAQEARATLAPLPECVAKSALEELCDAVVHRRGLGAAVLRARSGVSPASPANPYGGGAGGSFPSRRVAVSSLGRTQSWPRGVTPRPRPLWSDGDTPDRVTKR